MSSSAAGNIIAFDFGLKHIGVAVGQTITASARGVITISAKQGKPRWADILDLLEAYKPIELVVGQPLNMDGSVSAMSQRAAAFAAQLRSRSNIDVFLHDERLTSKAAKELFAEAKALGQAATEHELAACLILESYLAERHQS